MSKRSLFALLILFVAVAAGAIVQQWREPVQLPHVVSGDPARSECPDRLLDEYYWPAETFGAPATDEWTRRWYSIHLRSMNEPSLSCGASDDSYRFVWLRASRAPIVVRMTRDKTGRVTVVAVETSGRGGLLIPGTVTKRLQREVTAAEWAAATERLNGAAFWVMSTWSRSDVEDGAQWLIEARVGTAYHVADRRSPEDGPFRKAGLFLLRQSTIRLVPDEIY